MRNPRRARCSPEDDLAIGGEPHLWEDDVDLVQFVRERGEDPGLSMGTNPSVGSWPTYPNRPKGDSTPTTKPRISSPMNSRSRTRNAPSAALAPA